MGERKRLVTVLATDEERRAYKLAALTLGYRSLSEMIREILEQRVARARKQGPSFDAILKGKEQEDDE